MPYVSLTLFTNKDTKYLIGCEQCSPLRYATPVKQMHYETFNVILFVQLSLAAFEKHTSLVVKMKQPFPGQCCHHYKKKRKRGMPHPTEIRETSDRKKNI